MAENVSPQLTQTRTVTVTLYGDDATDWEAVLEGMEDGLRRYDDTGIRLDWNIRTEADRRLPHV